MFLSLVVFCFRLSSPCLTDSTSSEVLSPQCQILHHTIFSVASIPGNWNHVIETFFFSFKKRVLQAKGGENKTSLYIEAHFGSLKEKSFLTQLLKRKTSQSSKVVSFWPLQVCCCTIRLWWDEQIPGGWGVGFNICCNH